MLATASRYQLGKILLLDILVFVLVVIDMSRLDVLIMSAVQDGHTHKGVIYLATISQKQVCNKTCLLMKGEVHSFSVLPVSAVTVSDSLLCCIHTRLTSLAFCQ